jgi:hypothetical protein
MRQSELRLRGHRPGAVVAAVQADAMLSIGATRAAHTATLPAGPHAVRRSATRRVQLVAGMVAGFVLAAAGAFVVVNSLRRHPNTAVATSPQDAHPRDAAIPVLDARPLDAALPDAALAPPDAALATKKEPPASAGARAVPDGRVGELVVSAFPVLTVYVDNRLIGDTPTDVTLPVGRHIIQLVNADLHHDEKLTVTISEHQTTRIDRQ